jgi:hypothetical protein
MIVDKVIRLGVDDMTALPDLTLEQLQDMIAQEVQRQLRVIYPDNGALKDDSPLDTRTWEEVKRSIEANRWTPPPGSPSVLDIIRQDRDR